MKVPVTLPGGYGTDLTELAEAIEDFNLKAQTQPVLGMFGLEQSLNPNLERASHQVVNLNLAEDGSVSGTLKVLKTPQGELLKTLIESAACMKYSLVGTCNLRYSEGSDRPPATDFEDHICISRSRSLLNRPS